MKSDAERRALLDELRPRLMEILNAPTIDGKCVNGAALGSDIEVARKEFDVGRRRH